jgi:hypothetical protein
MNSLDRDQRQRRHPFLTWSFPSSHKICRLYTRKNTPRSVSGRHVRSHSTTAFIIWSLLSRGTEPGKAHGLLKAWSGWEAFSHYLWPCKQVPGAPYQLLQMRVATYSGRPFMLPDGVKIERGINICELHCNNRNILRLSTAGMNVFRATREDLRSLAAWLTQIDGNADRVLAFYGITMLTKGALRLGFVLRQQQPTICRRFQKIFMTGLLLLYSTVGVQRLMTGSTRHTCPQEVWMSRATLIQRYGDRCKLRPVERKLEAAPVTRADGSLLS